MPRFHGESRPGGEIPALRREFCQGIVGDPGSSGKREDASRSDDQGIQESLAYVTTGAILPLDSLLGVATESLLDIGERELSGWTVEIERGNRQTLVRWRRVVPVQQPRHLSRWKTLCSRGESPRRILPGASARPSREEERDASGWSAADRPPPAARSSLPPTTSPLDASRLSDQFSSVPAGRP